MTKKAEQGPRFILLQHTKHKGKVDLKKSFKLEHCSKEQNIGVKTSQHYSLDVYMLFW